jgi:hypothetical protein
MLFDEAALENAEIPIKPAIKAKQYKRLDITGTVIP